VPFTAKVVDPVLFLRWIQVEAGDAKAVVELVKRTAQSLDRAPVYIAIVPESLPIPDERARQDLTWGLRHVIANSRCAHLVIEGSGFRKVMLRAAAATIFLAAGQRGKATVHDSLDDALSGCEHTAANKAKLRRRFELSAFSEPIPAAVNHK
jgi:hypothetical protein